MREMPLDPPRTSRGEYLHRRDEERVNALTHGLGTALALAGLAILLVLAARRGDAREIVAVAIYGSSLVLLYLASTLYHALRPGRAKEIFQAIDHLAIYLLIAGTYTPFTLLLLRGGWGWTLLGVIWALAAVGVVQELLLARRIRWISLALYLSMGWLIVIAARPLASKLPPAGIALLLAGGVAYSGGIVFYLSRRVPHHHAVWHLCVLAGSVCHYLVVLRWVVPA